MLSTCKVIATSYHLQGDTSCHLQGDASYHLQSDTSCHLQGDAAAANPIGRAAKRETGSPINAPKLPNIQLYPLPQW